MNEQFEFHIRQLIREINIYLGIIVFLSIVLVAYVMIILTNNGGFSMPLFTGGIVGFVLFLFYYIFSTIKSRYTYMLENYIENPQEILTMIHSQLLMGTRVFKKRLNHYEHAYQALMHKHF